MKTLKRLWKGEQGEDVLEYTLLIVLAALVAAAALKTLASALSATFPHTAANPTSAAS